MINSSVHSSFLKLTSGLTLALYLLTQGVCPTGYAASRPPDTKSFQSLEMALKALPQSLGSVSELWHSSQSDKPFVLFVQDAHGQIEAQKNTQRLLKFIDQRVPLKTFLIEGGAGRLDPEKLRLFKESSLNLAAAKWFLREGDLGGAELFLLSKAGVTQTQKKQSPVFAMGAEDRTLYLENLKLFEKVAAQRPAADAWLAKELLNLEKRASHVLNPELLRFFKAWQVFEEMPGQLEKYFAVLEEAALKNTQIQLSDAASQQAWPMLVRFSELKRRQTQVNYEEASKDSARLRDWAESKQLRNKPLVLRLRAMQNRTAGSALTDLRGQWEDFYQSAKPLGFRFEEYPSLILWEGTRILESEMDAPLLMTESGLLRDRILENLALQPKEQAVIQAYRDYLLLEKLFRLRLDRSDFEKLTQAQASFLLSLGESGVRTVFNHALQFYKTAIAREQHMIRNLLRAEDAQSVKVFVAGGFHTPELTRHSREAGYSYAVISPHMSRVEDEKRYWNSMVGTNPLLAPPVLKVSNSAALPQVSHVRLASLLADWQTDLPRGMQDRRAEMFASLRQAGLRAGAALTRYADRQLPARSEVRVAAPARNRWQRALLDSREQAARNGFILNSSVLLYESMRPLVSRINVDASEALGDITDFMPVPLFGSKLSGMVLVPDPLHSRNPAIQQGKKYSATISGLDVPEELQAVHKLLQFAASQTEPVPDGGKEWPLAELVPAMEAFLKRTDTDGRLPSERLEQLGVHTETLTEDAKVLRLQETYHQVKKMAESRRTLLESFIRVQQGFEQRKVGDKVSAEFVQNEFKRLVSELSDWPSVARDFEAYLRQFQLDETEEDLDVAAGMIEKGGSFLRQANRYQPLAAMAQNRGALVDVYYDTVSEVLTDQIAVLKTLLEESSSRDELNVQKSLVIEMANQLIFLGFEFLITDMLLKEAKPAENWPQKGFQAMSAAGGVWFDKQGEPSDYFAGGGYVDFDVFRQRFTPVRILDALKRTGRETAADRGGLILFYPSESGYPNPGQWQAFLEDSAILQDTIPSLQSVRLGTVTADGATYVFQRPAAVLEADANASFQAHRLWGQYAAAFLQWSQWVQDLPEFSVQGFGPGAQRGPSSKQQGKAIRDAEVKALRKKLEGLNDTLKRVIKKNLPQAQDELFDALKTEFRSKIREALKIDNPENLKKRLDSLAREIFLIAGERITIMAALEAQSLEPVKVPGLSEGLPPGYVSEDEPTAASEAVIDAALLETTYQERLRQMRGYKVLPGEGQPDPERQVEAFRAFFLEWAPKYWSDNSEKFPNAPKTRDAWKSLQQDVSARQNKAAEQRETERLAFEKDQQILVDWLWSRILQGKHQSKFGEEPAVRAYAMLWITPQMIETYRQDSKTDKGKPRFIDFMRAWQEQEKEKDPKVRLARQTSEVVQVLEQANPAESAAVETAVRRAVQFLQAEPSLETMQTEQVESALTKILTDHLGQIESVLAPHLQSTDTLISVELLTGLSAFQRLLTNDSLGLDTFPGVPKEKAAALVEKIQAHNSNVVRVRAVRDQLALLDAEKDGWETGIEAKLDQSFQFLETPELTAGQIEQIKQARTVLFERWLKAVTEQVKQVENDLAQGLIRADGVKTAEAAVTRVLRRTDFSERSKGLAGAIAQLHSFVAAHQWLTDVFALIEVVTFDDISTVEELLEASEPLLRLPEPWLARVIDDREMLGISLAEKIALLALEIPEGEELAAADAMTAELNKLRLYFKTDTERILKDALEAVKELRSRVSKRAETVRRAEQTALVAYHTEVTQLLRGAKRDAVTAAAILAQPELGRILAQQNHSLMKEWLSSLSAGKEPKKTEKLKSFLKSQRSRVSGLEGQLYDAVSLMANARSEVRANRNDKRKELKRKAAQRAADEAQTAKMSFLRFAIPIAVAGGFLFDWIILGVSPLDPEIPQWKLYSTYILTAMGIGLLALAPVSIPFWIAQWKNAQEHWKWQKQWLEARAERKQQQFEERQRQKLAKQAAQLAQDQENPREDSPKVPGTAEMPEEGASVIETPLEEAIHNFQLGLRTRLNAYVAVARRKGASRNVEPILAEFNQMANKLLGEIAEETSLNEAERLQFRQQMAGDIQTVRSRIEAWIDELKEKEEGIYAEKRDREIERLLRVLEPLTERAVQHARNLLAQDSDRAFPLEEALGVFEDWVRQARESLANRLELMAVESEALERQIEAVRQSLGEALDQDRKVVDAAQEEKRQREEAAAQAVRDFEAAKQAIVDYLWEERIIGNNNRAKFGEENEVRAFADSWITDEMVQAKQAGQDFLSGKHRFSDFHKAWQTHVKLQDPHYVLEQEVNRLIRELEGDLKTVEAVFAAVSGAAEFVRLRTDLQPSQVRRIQRAVVKLMLPVIQTIASELKQAFSGKEPVSENLGARIQSVATLLTDSIFQGWEELAETTERIRNLKQQIDDHNAAMELARVVDMELTVLREISLEVDDEIEAALKRSSELQQSPRLALEQEQTLRSAREALFDRWVEAAEQGLLEASEGLETESRNPEDLPELERARRVLAAEEFSGRSAELESFAEEVEKAASVLRWLQSVDAFMPIMTARDTEKFGTILKQAAEFVDITAIWSEKVKARREALSKAAIRSFAARVTEATEGPVFEGVVEKLQHLQDLTTYRPEVGFSVYLKQSYDLVADFQQTILKKRDELLKQDAEASKKLLAQYLENPQPVAIAAAVFLAEPSFQEVIQSNRVVSDFLDKVSRGVPLNNLDAIQAFLGVDARGDKIPGKKAPADRLVGLKNRSFITALTKMVAALRSEVRSDDAEKPSNQVTNDNLITEDSLIARFGRGLGVSFYVPVSAKKDGFWQATLNLTESEREAVDSRLLPAYKNNNKLKPSVLRMVFEGDQPVLLITDGIAWSQVPADIREGNEQAHIPRFMRPGSKRSREKEGARARQKFLEAMNRKTIAFGLLLTATSDADLLTRAGRWFEAQTDSVGTYGNRLFEMSPVDINTPIVRFASVYPPNSVSSHIFTSDIRPKENSLVYVLGTGTVVDALAAAERTETIEVVAADIDALAVENARWNVEQSPYAQKIKVYQADLLAIPGRPADEKADAIYFNISLNMDAEDGNLATADPGMILLSRLLADAPRRLKTGGSLEINYVEQPDFLEKVYAAGWEPVLISGIDISRKHFPDVAWDYVRVTLQRPDAARSEALKDIALEWARLASIQMNLERSSSVKMTPADREYLRTLKEKYSAEGDFTAKLLLKAVHTLERLARGGMFVRVPADTVRINEAYQFYFPVLGQFYRNITDASFLVKVVAVDLKKGTFTIRPYSQEGIPAGDDQVIQRKHEGAFVNAFTRVLAPKRSEVRVADLGIHEREIDAAVIEISKKLGVGELKTGSLNAGDIDFKFEYGKSAENHPFVRIGPLVFIQYHQAEDVALIREKIGADLLRRFGNNIIFYVSPDTAWARTREGIRGAHETITYYPTPFLTGHTSAMIGLMMHRAMAGRNWTDRWTDEVVADFFSGNGILGVVSLRLGARKVYEVEVKDKLLQRAAEVFQVNGYEVDLQRMAGPQVIFIQKSIESATLPSEVLSMRGLNEVETVLSHAGPAYPDLDRWVLNFAANSQTVHDVLMGGYGGGQAQTVSLEKGQNLERDTSASIRFPDHSLAGVQDMFEMMFAYRFQHKGLRSEMRIVTPASKHAGDSQVRRSEVRAGNQAALEKSLLSTAAELKKLVAAREENYRGVIENTSTEAHKTYLRMKKISEISVEQIHHWAQALAQLPAGFSEALTEGFNAFVRTNGVKGMDFILFEPVIASFQLIFESIADEPENAQKLLQASPNTEIVKALTPWSLGSFTTEQQERMDVFSYWIVFGEEWRSFLSSLHPALAQNFILAVENHGMGVYAAIYQRVASSEPLKDFIEAVNQATPGMSGLLFAVAPKEWLQLFTLARQENQLPDAVLGMRGLIENALRHAEGNTPPFRAALWRFLYDKSGTALPTDDSRLGQEFTRVEGLPQKPKAYQTAYDRYVSLHKRILEPEAEQPPDSRSLLEKAQAVPPEQFPEKWNKVSVERLLRTKQPEIILAALLSAVTPDDLIPRLKTFLQFSDNRQEEILLILQEFDSFASAGAAISDSVRSWLHYVQSALANNVDSMRAAVASLPEDRDMRYDYAKRLAASDVPEVVAEQRGHLEALMAREPNNAALHYFLIGNAVRWFQNLRGQPGTDPGAEFEKILVLMERAVRKNHPDIARNLNWDSWIADVYDEWISYRLSLPEVRNEVDGDKFLKEVLEIWQAARQRFPENGVILEELYSAYAGYLEGAEDGKSLNKELYRRHLKEWLDQKKTSSVGTYDFLSLIGSYESAIENGWLRDKKFTEAVALMREQFEWIQSRSEDIPKAEMETVYYLMRLDYRQWWGALYDVPEFVSFFEDYARWIISSKALSKGRYFSGLNNAVVLDSLYDALAPDVQAFFSRSEVRIVNDAAGEETAVTTLSEQEGAPSKRLVRVIGVSAYVPPGIYVQDGDAQGFVPEQTLPGDPADYFGFGPGSGFLDAYALGKTAEVNGQVLPLYALEYHPSPAWQELAALTEPDETPLEVTVTGFIRKESVEGEAEGIRGLEVDYKGLRGIVPLSQLPAGLHFDPHDIQKAETLVGRKFTAHFLRFGRERVTPVFSLKKSAAPEIRQEFFTARPGTPFEVKLTEVAHFKDDPAYEPHGINGEWNGIRLFIPWVEVPMALRLNIANLLGRTMTAYMRRAEDHILSLMKPWEAGVSDAASLPSRFPYLQPAQFEPLKILYLTHRRTAQGMKITGLRVSWRDGLYEGTVPLENIPARLAEGSEASLKLLVGRALVGQFIKVAGRGKRFFQLEPPASVTVAMARLSLAATSLLAAEALSMQNPSDARMAFTVIDLRIREAISVLAAFGKKDFLASSLKETKKSANHITQSVPQEKLREYADWIEDALQLLPTENLEVLQQVRRVTASPGQRVSLTLQLAGKPLQIEITVGAKPDAQERSPVKAGLVFESHEALTFNIRKDWVGRGGFIFSDGRVDYNSLSRQVAEERQDGVYRRSLNVSGTQKVVIHHPYSGDEILISVEGIDAAGNVSLGINEHDLMSRNGVFEVSADEAKPSTEGRPEGIDLKDAFVLLLPGTQPVQKAGLGKDYYDHYPVFKKAFDRAAKIYGADFDLIKMAFEGTTEELNRLQNSQAVQVALAYATYRLLKTQLGASFKLGAVAGNSTNGLTAMVISGSISLRNALFLALAEGRELQKIADRREGGMAVIEGLDEQSVRQIAQESGTEVAIVGGPTRFNLAGSIANIDRAVALAKQRGTRRARSLPMGVAAHSSGVREVAEALAVRDLIQKMRIRVPKIPLIGSDGNYLNTADKVRTELQIRLKSPVLWHQVLTRAQADGAQRFIELGTVNQSPHLMTLTEQGERSDFVGSRLEVADFEVAVNRLRTALVRSEMRSTKEDSIRAARLAMAQAIKLGGDSSWLARVENFPLGSPNSEGNYVFQPDSGVRYLFKPGLVSTWAKILASGERRGVGYVTFEFSNKRKPKVIQSYQFGPGKRTIGGQDYWELMPTFFHAEIPRTGGGAALQTKAWRILEPLLNEEQKMKLLFVHVGVDIKEWLFDFYEEQLQAFVISEEAMRILNPNAEGAESLELFEAGGILFLNDVFWKRLPEMSDSEAEQKEAKLPGLSAYVKWVRSEVRQIESGQRLAVSGQTQAQIQTGQITEQQSRPAAPARSEVLTNTDSPYVERLRESNAPLVLTLSEKGEPLYEGTIISFTEAARYPEMYARILKFTSGRPGKLRLLLLGPGMEKNITYQTPELLALLNDREVDFTIVGNKPDELIAAAKQAFYPTAGFEKIDSRMNKDAAFVSVLSQLRASLHAIESVSSSNAESMMFDQTLILNYPETFPALFDKLNYGENELDLIIATLSIIYPLEKLPEIERLTLLLKIIRALRPGGKLFIEDSTLQLLTGRNKDAELSADELQTAGGELQGVLHQQMPDVDVAVFGKIIEITKKSEVRKSASIQSLSASQRLSENEEFETQAGSKVDQSNRVGSVLAVAKAMTAKIVRIADLRPEILEKLFPSILKKPEVRLSEAERRWILSFYTALFKQGSSIMLPAALLQKTATVGQRDYLELLIEALKTARVSPREPLVHIVGDTNNALKNLFFAPENWRNDSTTGTDVSRAVKFWRENEAYVAARLEKQKTRFAAAVTKSTALRARAFFVKPSDVRKLTRVQRVIFQARLTQLLQAASALNEEEFAQLTRELGLNYQIGEAIALTPSAILSSVFAERMNALALAVSA